MRSRLSSKLPSFHWTLIVLGVPLKEYVPNGSLYDSGAVSYTHLTLRFPDQNDFELDANLLLDTLHSDSPALPKEDNDRLFYTCLLYTSRIILGLFVLKFMIS